MLFLFTGACFVWLLRTFIITFHKTQEHLQSIIFQVVQNNKHCQCAGFTSTYTMQGKKNANARSFITTLQASQSLIYTSFFMSYNLRYHTDICGDIKLQIWYFIQIKLMPQT